MTRRIRFRATLVPLAVVTLALLSPTISAREDDDERAAIGWLDQVAGLGFAAEIARAVDSDLWNVYTAGETTGALPGQVSAGNLDAFVRKSDVATGTVVGWTVQFGTSGNDSARGVAADAARGVVWVAGSTQGTLPFPGLSQTGNEDAFVVKLDTATGAVLFADQFGSVGLGQSTFARGIAVDPVTGDVYVARIADGTLPGQTGSGGADAFVRKYEVDGMELWTHQFGTPDVDVALSVAVDPGTGDVYVAGRREGGDAFVEKRDATSGNLVDSFGIGGTVQFGGFTAGEPNFDQATGVTVAGPVVWVAGAAEGGTLDLVPSLSFLGGTSDAFVAAFDASTGDVLCADQFGSPGNDQALGISAGSGSAFVTGFTPGTNPLPGAPAAFGGSLDGFVRRYDTPVGTTPFQCTSEWTRQIGSTSVDQALGISTDILGLVVVGFTDGTFLDQISKGSRDAFAQRLDLVGNVVWTDQFGNPIPTAPVFDRAADVDTDEDGSASVVGATAGTLPGQVSAGTLDAWVRMYDARGNTLWTDQFGTGQNDEALGVNLGPWRVFVAGRTGGALPGQVHQGGNDAFLRVYGALTGTQLWTRQFGTGAGDFARRVKADATGIYVAGFTDGTLPGQISAGGRDAFVRKYDFNGTELWTRQFGSGGFQDAYGFTLDDQGNVFVVGWTDGPALPDAVQAPGNSNFFVRMYDTDGNHVWTRQLGSAGAFSWATGVSVHASQVFVVGVTSGSLPGPNLGGPDVFVHKFSRAGKLVWARQFGTPGIERHPPGGGFGTSPRISAADEELLVAAATSGTLPGQTSAGGFDAFVLRLRQENGDVVSTLQFGTPANDGVLGVSVDDDDSQGRVAGVTQGELTPGPDQGATDAFVAEIIEPDDDEDESDKSEKSGKGGDEN